MKHVVFLLHGMGVYDARWQKPYVDAICAVYDRYPNLHETAFDERFEIVPVTYDDVFRQIVSTWEDNAKLIAALPDEISSKAVTRLTSWLKNAGELNGNNFGWTHAADVLLFRAFRLVRERVCVRVAKQIVDKVQEQYAKFQRSSWSAIGHSLGTAVLHDTLARLADPNATWQGHAAFAGKNEQARLIMMVANVSRVLEVKTPEEPYDAYLSAVKPGFAGQDGRACLYYFTPRHKFDPFTIPSMFHPAAWPDQDALAANPPRYVYQEVDHIHDSNVHAFEHYIAHPLVHIPMFRVLTAPEFISDDEERQALDKFDPFGTLGHDAAIKIRQKLEDRLPPQAEDWAILGQVWKSFFS